MQRIRYQTGEISEIIEEMKNKVIPCMDVDTKEEYEWVIGQFAGRGIYKVESLSGDNSARDKEVEPEFEYRDAFSNEQEPAKVNDKELMYVDFFTEVEEETYDPVGEM